MKRLIWLFLIGMAFAQADGPGGATNGTVPNKCGRGTNPCTVANALNVAGQITATGGFLSTGLTLNGAGTPNSSSGTSNGLLAKLVNNGGVVQIQTLGTSDTTSYPLLVVAQRNTSTNAINGCTAACTTNNAYVAAVGTVAACTFDNTAVVGDFVIDGTTGQCHDTGSATAPTSGTFVGRARTAGTGSQSVSIEPQVAGGAGGASPTLFTATPQSAVTLTGGTDVLWTYNIPAGTFTAANQCIRINISHKKTANANSTLYKIQYAGNTSLQYTSGTGNSLTATELYLCTYTDTAHEELVNTYTITSTSVLAGVTANYTSDATAQQTLNVTASGTAADVVTNFVGTVTKMF